MFDVVICTVSTGKVTHKVFETHEAAQRFADNWLEKALNNKRRKIQPSAREWRITINQIELPAVRPAEDLTKTAA